MIYWLLPRLWNKPLHSVSLANLHFWLGTVGILDAAASYRLRQGLIAYVERLKGTARLRPDNKLVIQREWGNPAARLNGLIQLTKGLAQIAARALRIA